MRAVGDRCDGAIPVGALPFTDTRLLAGTGNDYQVTDGCVGLASNTEGPDLVYAFTPPTDGSYQIEALGSTFDPIVYVVENCATPNASCLGGAPGILGRATRLATLSGGETVFIVIESPQAEGEVALSVTKVEGGDRCVNADSIDPNALPITLSSGTGAGVRHDYTAISGSCPNQTQTLGALAPDIAFALTPDEDRPYRFGLDADFNAALYLVTDCEFISCVGALEGNGDLVLPLNAGTTYYAIIDGQNPGNQGDFDLTVEAIHGDTCADPQNIDTALFPAVINSDTTFAGFDHDHNAGVCPGNPNAEGLFGRDLVFRFTPEETSIYTVTLDNADFNATVYVTSDCTNPSDACLASSDDPNIAQPIVLLMAQGVDYFIIVDGVAPQDAGPFTLTVDKQTLGDTCDQATAIDPAQLPVMVSGNTSTANGDYDYIEGACSGEMGAGGGGAADVVYNFTPATTGTYSFDLNSDFPATVYTVTDCTNVDQSCMGASATVEGTARLEVDLNQGTPYSVIIDGASLLNTGSFTMTVDSAGDTCEKALLIEADQLPFSDAKLLDTFSDTYSYNAGACPGVAGGFGDGTPDVAYRFTPDTTDTYTIEMRSGGYEGNIYITTDCTQLETTCLAADTDPGLATVTTTLLADTDYFIILDGVNLFDAFGTYELFIEPTP